MLYFRRSAVAETLIGNRRVGLLEPRRIFLEVVVVIRQYALTRAADGHQIGAFGLSHRKRQTVECVGRDLDSVRSTRPRRCTVPHQLVKLESQRLRDQGRRDVKFGASALRNAPWMKGNFHLTCPPTRSKIV